MIKRIIVEQEPKKKRKKHAKYNKKIEASKTADANITVQNMETHGKPSTGTNYS